MRSLWNRRRLLAAGGSLALAGATSARADAGPEVLDLWPNGAPGGERVTAVERRMAYNWPDGRVDYAVEGVTRPTLTLHAPTSGAPAKAAVLVIPGGGFSKVVIDKEGHDVARWLAANGVHAGVLLYRLPRDGWSAGADAPLQDAQRALRLLRGKAGGARTGALGFSAGGTIAAALASRGEAALYPHTDALDARPCLPDFVGLGYPWLNRPQAPKQATPFHGFTAPTKAFLFHAEDDPKVDARNSRDAAQAIVAAGGQAELRIFPSGGHGFALRSRPPAPEAAWSGDFLRWLDRLDG